MNSRIRKRSRTAKYNFMVKKSNNDSIVKDCLCVNVIHNILHKIYITILSLINNEFDNGNIILAYCFALIINMQMPLHLHIIKYITSHSRNSKCAIKASSEFDICLISISLDDFITDINLLVNLIDN